jgi:tRNA pseudouridine55 synthase
MGKRKGLPISGWLVIDKPLGLTSTQVVGRVRYLTKAPKVGHAGTLDPLATGVLPIALGEATKTVSYAMDGRKTYRFTVRWGATTTTDDSEGDIVRASDRRPSPMEIEAALPHFIGTIAQTPPRFSAIKIDGERAYDLARAGEDVALAARPVHIYALRIIEQPDADHTSFEAEVGKGFYIRALARDLAQNLGCEGHIAALCRLSVGKFTLPAAISLEKLEEAVQDGRLDEHLLPLATALDDIPALAVSDAEASRLRLGQSLTWFSRADADRLKPMDQTSEPIALALTGDKPVALVEVEGAEIRPVRVLNL